MRSAKERPFLALTYISTASRLHTKLRGTLEQHGLLALEFKVAVALLVSKSKCSTGAALASRAGISRTAITKAFDGLERKGLAVRRLNAENRRTLSGTLTAAGVVAVEKAIADFWQAAADLTKPLSNRQVADMLEACRALKHFESPATLALAAG